MRDIAFRYTDSVLDDKLASDMETWGVQAHTESRSWAERYSWIERLRFCWTADLAIGASCILVNYKLNIEQKIVCYPGSPEGRGDLPAACELVHDCGISVEEVESAKDRSALLSVKESLT